MSDCCSVCSLYNSCFHKNSPDLSCPYSEGVRYYPIPSPEVYHTVAFCLFCGCQRSFSFGFCDHWVNGHAHRYLGVENDDLYF